MNCQSISAADCSRPPADLPAELDEALLREVARNNQLAMRTLYTRHRVRLYRFIVRLVRDPALAEDVLSETFLAAWRQAGRFQGRSTVSTWLFGIARHKALTALDPRPLEALEDDIVDTLADPALDPDVADRRRDTGTIMRRCLGALSPEHGEIIDLVYYQEKSIKEIAAIVGIPLATVKTRMFYARKRLAALVQAADVDRVAS
jgi:RNA polymerase sigma-70 factor (ECF subfamily)